MMRLSREEREKLTQREWRAWLARSCGLSDARAARMFGISRGAFACRLATIRGKGIDVPPPPSRKRARAYTLSLTGLAGV